MPKWTCTSTTLDRATERYRVHLDGGPASFGATLDALVDHLAVREVLLGALRTCTFPAFFWETPPIAPGLLARPFEFVLADAPSLCRGAADYSSFAEHLDAVPASESTAAFSSLRGDALLIAPARRSSTADYAHLAAFVRSAPTEQQHDLLRIVAQRARERAASMRTWLSTAGLGVAWLHVRLDSVPKYYRFAEFRDG